MSVTLDDLPEISRQIWEAKYRWQPARGRGDRDLSDTWRRVAKAAASVEKPETRKRWRRAFREIMEDQTFLPAGRIIAGAGTGRRVTLFNCFVMGRIGDSLEDIFSNLREAALTMQQGGGIGHDFSTLRPHGALVTSIGADASGPLSFMDVWDAMCRTIMSAGARRGAMMGTLRCDHPDIEAFIDAKADSARLRMFNLSVLVTDDFIRAVQTDGSWPLVFAGKTYRTLRARELWQRIMRATYAYAEPGVIFIDRINAVNNLAHCETIQATNPCGEQPLPPYGACLLGSINLARLVRQPFADDASVDLELLRDRVAKAVRFLDNVIDVSGYPLQAQHEEALAKRRIGLGVTGLADALIMCGLDYASESGREAARYWMSEIEQSAYRASAGIAAEKGAFPLCEQARLTDRPKIRSLPRDIRKLISRHGLRNGLLTSIAPTGTISLLAGNVSSGVEPVFRFSYRRRILEADGSHRDEIVEDYAHRLWRCSGGQREVRSDLGARGRDTRVGSGQSGLRSIPGRDWGALPPAFVTAEQLLPEAHLAMQAALQTHVDSAISKTINCPENIGLATFESIYMSAWEKGLKGCTTFRPNRVTGSVLGVDSVTQDDAGAETRDEASVDVAQGGDMASTAAAVAASPVLRDGVRPHVQSARPAKSGSPDHADDHQDGAQPERISPAPAPLEHMASDHTASEHTASERRGLEYSSAERAPLQRDPVLTGFTYKIRWPLSEHALYVTINDTFDDGVRRPFEIFINSKNMEHYAWTLALTRMISAVFRRGGDVAFVVEELKAVFDPRGGSWSNGRYVPSLLAAIGNVIEEHMAAIGFIQPIGQGAGNPRRQNCDDGQQRDGGAPASGSDMAAGQGIAGIGQLTGQPLHRSPDDGGRVDDAGDRAGPGSNVEPGARNPQGARAEGAHDRPHTARGQAAMGAQVEVRSGLAVVGSQTAVRVGRALQAAPQLASENPSVAARTQLRPHAGSGEGLAAAPAGRRPPAGAQPRLHTLPVGPHASSAALCRRCGSPDVAAQEGCVVCLTCGFSQCG